MLKSYHSWHQMTNSLNPLTPKRDQDRIFPSNIKHANEEILKKCTDS